MSQLLVTKFCRSMHTAALRTIYKGLKKIEEESSCEIQVSDAN